MTRVRALVSALALVAIARGVAPAEPGQCHAVDVEFQPAVNRAPPMCPFHDDNHPPQACPELPPQIVGWIETVGGTFVATAYITQRTGSYGLGNRPGRFDFNSGRRWPYGRRITVFPVWAHRKTDTTRDGSVLTFPEVGFQDGAESGLSHSAGLSSLEKPGSGFFRPMMPSEHPAWDTGSSASAMIYTDKGVLSATATSLYPPREDVVRNLPVDSASVDLYAGLNPYDAVSQATPLGDTPARFSWEAPPELPDGAYVLWLEVSKEFDHNATYSADARPAPPGNAWSSFGEPYRGQPSVIYTVPFTVGASQTVASTLDYAGYGDPDGNDGDVRPRDATITADVPGAGAGRLAMMFDGTSSYRVRVTSHVEHDTTAPAAPREMSIETSTSRSATIQFVAPGDDGMQGRVKGYRVRYRIGGDPITDTNFDDPGSHDPKPAMPIGDAGGVETFTLEGLLPLTDYSVGIRAFDDCGNTGPLTVLSFTTPDRVSGEVDWCFIATAAYGSVLAADVELLRRFRDGVLRRSVLGELAVETYYTFSPAVAGVIGESELLRASVRTALSPLIAWIRQLRF